MNDDRRSKARPSRGNPARSSGRRGPSPARPDARRGAASARPRRDGDARAGRSADARPRREGYARPRRDADARPRREGYAPPRRNADARPRREGSARPWRDADARPGREGYAPRATRSREGFAPRGRADAPRDGSRSRDRGERRPYGSGRPAPRSGRRPYTGERPAPRGERRGYERRPYAGDRPAPRGDRRGPPREFTERKRFERPHPERPAHDRPHSERPRFDRSRADRPAHDRPRAERPRFERRGTERQRPEHPRAERPRFERARPERPRFERPRPERPRIERPAYHDDGGDQTGAVNRSRPAYAQGPNVRWRRDGKRSATARLESRPGGWPEQGPDGPRHANGGSSAVATHRPAVAPATDGPSLPADPREAALRILHAVDTRSAFSDRLLDGAHARPGADPRDRALLHELVKGALRWRGRIDAALDARVHVGLANTQPWIRNILRLGAYQILFLDRIPAHAAVDESVKLAHKYAHAGAAGLVNSVLRRLAEERATIRWPEGDDAASLVAWGSHPLWIVERWLARFGPAETRALLTADNRTVPTGLRANTLRNTREQLVEMLAHEGVEARPAQLSPDLVWVEGHHSPGALHCFRSGLCTAQDESEALVGRVVAPQPHERVLDLCAAPGGKSTHLAELMHDDGEVWAMERDAHRVETLKTTLERLGTHSVHVVHGDGRTYEFPMPFDRVLVDAPCSGMGVLARRADARWRKGPEVLAEMPPVQLDLLRSAAERLVPGGLLVYSVCSFEPEETDHVVARFLSEHPGWRLESVAGAVPDAVVTPEGFMRTLPHQHGCDGAFAARIRKP